MNRTEKRVRLSWDTVLLLALATAHMWFNQISSAFLVLLLSLYVILDIVDPGVEDSADRPESRRSLPFLARITILFFTALFAAVLPAGLEIIQRLESGPAQHAVDGLIQTEVATQFLLAGKNPYAEDYLDTPLAQWDFGEQFPYSTIRGPLYHNVYLPALFLLSVPFYALSRLLLGWYDQRILYLLCFSGILLLLPLLTRNRRNQLNLIVLIGLNLFFILFLAEGRNDVVILLGLVLSTALLSRRHTKSSAFVLGLTLTIKHQAWFFLPFYLLYTLPKELNRRTVANWVLSLWPLYVTVAAVLLPFLLWDPAAFIEDTVLYITGQTEYSFPIVGIGFSRLLLATGLVDSPYAPFPFVLMSLLAGLPVMLVVLRRQFRHNSLANMWYGFTAFAFVFQFFSRFFNDNYFVFLLQALFIALFVDPVTFHPDSQAGEEPFELEEKTLSAS